MADWKQIKAEYITTNTSYRKLSEKYGVHYKTIADKGKDEGWKELRSQHTHKTLTKALNAISNKQVDRAANLINVSDLLLDKVKQLIENDAACLIDTQSLKHISGVLKDIKEIQMIRSDADLREQNARIQKLERDAQRDASDDKEKTVIVTIAGGEESWQS